MTDHPESPKDSPDNENEERFRSVSEMISDYCYSVVIGENGEIRNEWSFGAWEKITGYRRNEIWESGGLPSIIHPEDLEKTNEKVRRLLAGKIETSRIRIICKDGEVKWMEDTARPVWNEDRTRVNRVLGCARDITRQVLAEELLRETQKMESLGHLAGGIAHDFNNILGGIVGCAELAKSAAAADSEIDRYMNDILAASERARRLIKQILTFSSRDVSPKRPVDIGPIVMEAARLLRAALPDTVEIETNVSPEPLNIDADPDQIHEVLMNLGTNASFAMDRNGCMSISCERTNLRADVETRTGTATKGEYIRLRIQDSGCGMDPHTLSRAFEPFFTTKPKSKGTGLGLSVVFGIVKSHGGHITVDSTPGKGCTFEIYLPAAAALASVPAAPSEMPAANRGEHILFLDDEQLLCDVQSRVLESLGYRVTVFTDPETAWQAFREQPNIFDLIITDYSMPHMTGTDFAAKVLEIAPNAKILLCTGYSNTVTGTSTAALGIRGFLLKPFRKAVLAKTVRNLLNG